MFTELNFKSANANGGAFYALWFVVTILNAVTVFALVASALLAWRYFG
jgi:hypothetical protein